MRTYYIGLAQAGGYGLEIAKQLNRSDETVSLSVRFRSVGLQTP